MSAIVTNAKYVYVTTSSGDLMNPNVNPADRAAGENVQKAIEKWGRYQLVLERGQADIILVVRTGRTLESGFAIQSGTNARGPGVSGQSLGAQVGDTQDRLEVYDPSEGIDGIPLWKDRAAHGLQLPGMQLMSEFRTEVEAATKKKP